MFLLPSMSLNIPLTSTQPCTKPYTLTLQDCLACSSCITDSTLQSYTKLTTLSLPTILLITPHSKLNIYYTICTNTNSLLSYQNFENILFDFNILQHNLIVDVSNFYSLISKDLEQIAITSNCPAVVNYLRGKNKYVNKLRKVKSVQQVCRDVYERDGRRMVSVCGCLDKKWEGGEVMMTGEYYSYLIEKGFEEYIRNNNIDDGNYNNDGNKNVVNIISNNDGNCNNNSDSDKNNTNSNRNDNINEHNKNRVIDVNTDDIYSDFIHKTAYFDKIFINNLIDSTFKAKIINDDYIEYTNGKLKYARINGLVNFVNYLSKAEKHNYQFVEAYMCKSGCINGPGQLKLDLEKENDFMRKFKRTEVKVIGYNNDISREFKAERNIKMTFKVEW